MPKFTLDEVKAMLAGASDQQLHGTAIKVLLGLTPEKADTLFLAFAVCFRVEQGLERPWKSSFEKLREIYPEPAIVRAKQVLNEFLSNDSESLESLESVLSNISPVVADRIRTVINTEYQKRPSIDIDNLDTFGRKIRAYKNAF